MNKHTYETIIIGAGVAGLACARSLSKQRRDFLIVTEDVGGRIMTSESGLTNYGAYFVLDNYQHILPLVSRGERLHPFFVEFHDRKKRHYHLIQMAHYPLQLVRLMRLLFQFKSLYASFKKQCETKSQKSVIEGDEKLYKLYMQSASEFVRENKIEQIAKRFLSEGVYMCTFLPLNKVSAFDFLRLCLGLILPAYEFTFDRDTALKGFEDKILIDSVTKIHRGKTTYELCTKTGKMFYADNVVIATPTPQMKELVGIEKTKLPANAYVFHLTGELKPQWKFGQFELFSSDDSVIFIRKQRDGSSLFYSKIASPHLETYFVNPHVIYKKHWEPAFTITGDELIESNYKKGLYIIGDHNVIGLEDSYITGLFAAHHITHA